MNPPARPALNWRPMPAVRQQAPAAGNGQVVPVRAAQYAAAQYTAAQNTAPQYAAAQPPSITPASLQTASPAAYNAAAAFGPAVQQPPTTGTGGYNQPLVVRGQDAYGGRAIQPISPAPQSTSAYPPNTYPPVGTGGGILGQSPDPNAPGGGGIIPPLDPGLGGQPPEEVSGIIGPTPPPVIPSLPIDIDAQDTQTGKFSFGAGINSNAGLIGSVVIDEQNFDWTRPPTGWDSWRNGTACRGAGQHFRIELAPGTLVSRYLVSYNQPYLFNTNVSFGISGQFFQRFYTDWVEQRAGGRVSLGYQFRPDITGVVAFRGEAVDIKDPRILIPDLAQVLGITQLYSGQFKIINDIRDNTFFPTEGRYIEVSFEQAFGNFAFPKATLDMRKYFTVTQRPDGSGRQVLALYGFLGVTGKNTPIYERFFLGGMGTIRGFYYRGASPTVDTVEVGGDFATYGTVEYTFPITADDMFRGAVFCDAGIDARTADITTQDVRVAPGVGLRISVPAMGPAPISIDFAFPVVKTANDREQIINFSMGLAR